VRRWRRGTFLILAIVALLLATASCGADAPEASTSTAATEQPPDTLVGCAASATFAYADHPGVDPGQTSLDVYRPAPDGDGCRDRPLVVWVHGGGWTSGDKSEYVADKVTLFNGAGYVFASVNYRLTDKDLPTPAPQYPVHDQDTADALAWLVGHAEQIGADPSRVVVLGHSAGGGIVSAVGTDDRYLGASGLGVDAIDCAASMDGEGYDIVGGATTSPVEVLAVRYDSRANLVAMGVLPSPRVIGRAPDPFPSGFVPPPPN
jgi:acetyl esterase/lipase